VCTFEHALGGPLPARSLRPCEVERGATRGGLPSSEKLPHPLLDSEHESLGEGNPARWKGNRSLSLRCSDLSSRSREGALLIHAS
jgi:hypothetical protein